jgi:hypothetical protein
MSWEKVAAGEPQRVGERYRLVLSVKAPYNAINTAAIRAAFYLRAALGGELVIESTDHAPPLFSAHNSSLGPWPFWVYYHVAPKADVVQAGLDPRVIWALAALVIGGLLALAISAQRIEHLVSASGAAVNQPLQTLTNPGLIIAVLVAIALIMRRKR